MTVQHFAYSTFPNRDVGVLIASTFAPLTLCGCSVGLEVRGNCARVDVRYEYDNHSGKDQRVIAVYPLPAAWELMSCGAKYAGDRLLAELSDAAPLRSASAASAAGLPAPKSDTTARAVASQELPWVVGVGSRLLIAATYYVPLDITRSVGKVRLRLPEELFPRVNAPPPASLAYTALFDMKQPSELASEWTIDAHCDMFVPLLGAVRMYPLEDANAMRLEYIGDSSFTLHYSAPLTQRPQQGFEISCLVQKSVEPLRFFVAKDVGELVADADRYALTLCFTPQLEGRYECVTNAELVLVVDAHNPETLAVIARGILSGLHGLPESVLLNVVMVDAKKDISLCRFGAVPVNDAQLDQIAAFVTEARLQEANTGVSNIGRALRAVMSQEKLSLCGPIPKGYVRHVIVMSDKGEFEYATELIDFVARNRYNMCFSAVCVVQAGMPSDMSAVQLLVEEGGGVYREVEKAEECPEALAHVLSRVAVPTLTDVVLNFNEPELRLSIDKKIPAVAQGTQRFVYGIAPASIEKLGVYAKGRVGQTVIEFVGKANMQDVIFTSAAEFCNSSSFGLFHLAAAAARVRYLVDERAFSALSMEEMEEVRRLSKTFMLPSPYTQMLQYRAAAVCDASAKVSRSAVAVRYAPRSWTYARVMKDYRRQRLANSSFKSPSAKRREEERETAHRRGADAALLPPSTCREFLRAVVADVAESVVAGANVERLAALQSADGSFPLNATLCVCAGVPLASVPLSRGTGDDQEATDGRLLATAIAVASMDLRPITSAAMVYKKALMYVSKHDTGGEVASRAREIVGVPSTLAA